MVDFRYYDGATITDIRSLYKRGCALTLRTTSVWPLLIAEETGYNGV